MDSASLILAIKRKFRLTGATLDTDITASITLAVNSLAPYIKKSVVDSSLTANSTDDFLTIPVAYTGADLTNIFVKESNGLWRKFVDYSKDGDIIYLREYLDNASSIRLHLRVPFTFAQVATIPLAYSRALVELSCAEFATMLAGDKSSYNIYAQSNGARAVDNMLDLAEYYERTAERRLIKLNAGESVG